MRIGYQRVSTLDQNEARQLDSVEVEKMFIDRASGKDRNRPQLAACIEFAREGDVVLVHSLDRLGRSVTDLREIIAELNAKGVTVEVVSQGLTFTGKDSPMSTLLLTMLGAVAEFELATIRERQAEGIAQAKARGAYTGRKPALTEERAAELVARMNAGESVSALAKEFGISRASAYNYRNAA